MPTIKSYIMSEYECPIGYRYDQRTHRCIIESTNTILTQSSKKPTKRSKPIPIPEPEPESEPDELPDIPSLPPIQEPDSEPESEPDELPDIPSLPPIPEPDPEPDPYDGPTPYQPFIDGDTPIDSGQGLPDVAPPGPDAELPPRVAPLIPSRSHTGAKSPKTLTFTTDGITSSELVELALTVGVVISPLVAKSIINGSASSNVLSVAETEMGTEIELTPLLGRDGEMMFQTLEEDEEGTFVGEATGESTGVELTSDFSIFSEESQVATDTLLEGETIAGEGILETDLLLEGASLAGEGALATAEIGIAPLLAPVIATGLLYEALGGEQARAQQIENTNSEAEKSALQGEITGEDGAVIEGVDEATGGLFTEVEDDIQDAYKSVGNTVSKTWNSIFH